MGKTAAEFEDPLRAVYHDSRLHERFVTGIKPALLCVDLQYLDAARDQGIFAGLPPSAKKYYFKRLEEHVIPNVRRLQQAYRRHGCEVIHVRIQALTQDGRDRSPAHKRLGLLAPPGSWEAQFLDPVAPALDEIVINKTASGVFESTNLHYVLRNLGVERLVVTGVYTDECVSTTVRVGADLGFFITLVEDACTTVTPDLHHHAVGSLRHRYARVIDTQSAIRELGQSSPAAEGTLTPDADSARNTSGLRGTPAVVLLGGSALSDAGDVSVADELAAARRAFAKLQPLLDENCPVLISHGNGPQVGRRLSSRQPEVQTADALRLEVCVADSQGELGHVLQQTLCNQLRASGKQRDVVCVLSHTVVDATDPAFEKPSKPVGEPCSEEHARALRDAGWTLRHQPNGWQRVVASPEPREIVELSSIQALLRLGAIVIAAGGGGVPVVKRDDGRLEGIHAVVDKDLTGALIAQLVGARRLIVLTAVPCVYLDFQSDSQRPISQCTPKELRRLAAQGQFAEGTMAPKVEAACRFVETGGEALICGLDNLEPALDGHAGTWVKPDVDWD